MNIQDIKLSGYGLKCSNYDCEKEIVTKEDETAFFEDSLCLKCQIQMMHEMAETRWQKPDTTF